MKGKLKVKGEVINGCRVLGVDLKDLLFYPRGTLVFKGHDLVFVSGKDNMVRTLRVEQKALYPVVFVSNDFDEVEKIVDRYYEYILDFSEGYLFIRDGIIGDIKIMIKGFTY